MKTISTRELQDLQRNKEGSALVNVLSQADFRKGSIPGSVNAPIDSPSFLKDVEGQTGGDKQKRVVVYCAGPKCDASERAGKQLTEAGYSNVQVYRGGMEEWNSSQSGGRGQQPSGSSGEQRKGSEAAEMATNRGGSVREQNAPAPGERSTVGATREGAGARAQEQASGTGQAGTVSPAGQPRQASQPQGGNPNRGTGQPAQGEGGLEYGDTSKPKDGTDKSSDRPGKREDRGDNTPSGDPKREIGTTPPEPGYTTTAPHPDVIKPQSRSGERRTSPPEPSAPKQSSPGSGAGTESPAGGASQGSASKQ